MAEAAAAATVFWTGPMGRFESPPFAAGTHRIASAVARASAMTVVAGGPDDQGSAVAGSAGPRQPRVHGRSGHAAVPRGSRPTGDRGPHAVPSRRGHRRHVGACDHANGVTQPHPPRCQLCGDEISNPQLRCHDPKGDDMCHGMITMPLRIVACTTRLGVRLTEDVVGVALSVTRGLIEAAVPGEPQRAASGGGSETGGMSVGVIIASPPSTSWATPDRPSEDEAPDAAPGREGRISLAPAQASAAATSNAQSDRSSVVPVAPSDRSSAVPVAAPRAASPPMHVSEELRFVEAFAEPGAEEGAGADVHVKEPWNGYAHMSANEIIARLAGASREGVATVMLYERVHRRRQTVLAAAERQLRRATAGSSRHATAVDGSRRSGPGTSQ